MEANRYEKLDISEYTKAHSSEERKRVADSIRKIRSGYFGNQRVFSQTKSELNDFKGEKEKTAEELLEEVNNLDAQIEERTETGIKRFLNFFVNRKDRKQATGKRSELITTENEVADFENTISEIERQSADRSQLEKAKQELIGFYSGQSEKVREYKIDQERRDLSGNASEFDTVFIHGIHSRVPEANSLLQEGTRWDTKLKIVVAFAPTLSASSINKGDSPENMWSTKGVILNRGKIRGAFSANQATPARGISNKENSKTEGDIKVAIQKAIQDRHPNGYNEFVVDKPQIVGFYVTDKERAESYKHDVSDKEISETMDRLGIPIYLIKDGEVYSTSFNDNTGRFVPRTKVTPKEIAESSGVITEEVRERLVLDILEDSPFKLQVPDAYATEARAYGAGTYLSVRAVMDKSFLSGNQRFGSYPTVGRTFEFFSDGGELRKRTAFRTAKQATIEQVYFQDTEEGWIKPGDFFHNFKQDGGMHNPKDYLIAMSSWLRQEEEKLNQAGSNEEYRLRRIYFIRSLGFHLYGFAEQARSLGDGAIAVEAETLAETILEKDEYDKVLTTRIGENGEFRMTLEDIDVKIASSDRGKRMLNKILGSDYNPNKLVDFFDKRHPEIYSGDVGVWEGYSLRQHTLMVLNQYEKYFGDKKLPGNLDHKVMRVALALHDIGKPEAVRAGSKQLQHQYTAPVLQGEMDRLGFTPREIRIVSAMVNGDPIGNYIKGGDLQETVNVIKQNADNSGLSISDTLDLLEIYYLADAGSYTEDAGGKPSLDSLFDFDPKNRKIDFSSRTKSRILALESAIKEQ